MADGLYRSQQPGAGQFLFQTPSFPSTILQQAFLRNHSSSPNTLKNSNSLPPSRSPPPALGSALSYNMYTQGHQSQHAAMMNGSQAHRGFAMQMPKFQHQTHHPHHPQAHHAHHNQASHQLNHQPTYTAGALASTTPHFTPSHMQNGTPTHVEDEIDESMNEHWQQQLQLAAEARQATSPHYYARTIAQQTKGIQLAPSQTDGTDNAGDNRPSAAVSKDTKRQGWTSLDFTSQGLRAISTALFNYRFLSKLYLSNNKLKSLPSSIGQLRGLIHLDISGNDLTELPAEIGMLTNLRTLYAFDNHIQMLPFEMGYLYRLEMLGIYGNPLNEALSSQIKTHGTKALIKYLLEEMTVHLPPSDRDWIVLDETSKSSHSSTDRITVLSYNILCDQSASPSHYGYVPSRALSWEFRRDMILSEIRGHDADIACLQEIDGGNYNDFFREQLAYNDYKGVFWPRGRAMGMHEEEAKAIDGCATFFKTSKYILLDKQVINFGQTAVRRPDAKGQDDIYNRLWQKDHIAVVVFLENRMTGTRLIVANCHLYWDPAFKDVKLIQTAIMMEEITKLADEYAKFPPCTDKTAFRFSEAESGGAQDSTTPMEPAPSVEYSCGEQIPLLICGDFNSAPGEAAYNLLAHGKLTESHPDLQERLYGNLSRVGMTHPFKLKSAYSAIGELSFTNYTPDFTSILDYVWYSSTTLHVTGLLGEVDREYLKRVPGFPNYHFPSDHLAMLAEFSVKGKKGKVVEADFGPQRDKSVAMSTVEEGSLVLPDGTKLYTKTWKPEGTPKAIIAFYHGFSDHCNSWYQFFPNLAAAGFEVHSLDQRGWGESCASDRKLRGDYGTTAVVMADLHFFLQSLAPFTHEGSIPLFLMGHSMGGMNSLYYALSPESPYHTTASQKQAQLTGVVSIAPLVAIHPTTQPLKIIEYAGRLAAKLVPKWTMVQDIDPVWVSRDAAVVEAIRKDGRLCHKTGTFEALAGMLARGAWLDGLHKNQSEIASVKDAVPPLFVAHGTDDRITWFDATKRMVEAVELKDKTFKEYEGGYHKLTNDTHGVAEQFTADVVEWMNSKIV